VPENRLTNDMRGIVWNRLQCQRCAHVGRFGVMLLCRIEAGCDKTHRHRCTKESVGDAATPPRFAIAAGGCKMHRVGCSKRRIGLQKLHEDIAERGRQLRAEAGWRRSSSDKTLLREGVGERYLSEEVAQRRGSSTKK